MIDDVGKHKICMEGTSAMSLRVLSGVMLWALWSVGVNDASHP
jgi:hypothetical protein